MVIEANGSFLKLASIYLGMYHKQNISELHTELKTTFRTIFLWVVVILVTLLACLTLESIYSSLVDIILVLSHAENLAHNSGQFYNMFAEEVTRVEEMGGFWIRTE